MSPAPSFSTTATSRQAPAASGRLGQGPCRKLHQRGEGSSAEAGSEPWAAAATGARRAALARRCAANGASPCPSAGGGSSVLYHSRFAPSCSQVFCLFSIVPFTCFPSLQKSLALFKIDWEQLPRLYPEREREKNARTPSSYRVIKSFHSPSRSAHTPENPSSREEPCVAAAAPPATATKALLPRRAHLRSRGVLASLARTGLLVFLRSALNTHRKPTKGEENALRMLGSGTCNGTVLIKEHVS